MFFLPFLLYRFGSSLDTLTPGINKLRPPKWKSLSTASRDHVMQLLAMGSWAITKELLFHLRSSLKS